MGGSESAAPLKHMVHMYVCVGFQKKTGRSQLLVTK